MTSLSLQHDISAVLDLADHIRLLKDRAIELINQFEASSRGFFTPSEDEQTRQLLVSYWQSRNALFELVSERHRLSSSTSNDQQQQLTTAYAGALVLVDVARFLREHFHHRPVVRKKLNEPEPHFEIPAGTYDLVQKSLTRPTHAWHLYHAMTYVTQHWKGLRLLGRDDPQFGKLLDLIHELQKRLNVSPEGFVLARTRVRARSLRTRLSEKLLGRAAYGLQKAVSAFMADKYVRLGHQPSIPQEIEQQITEQLQPGDVIVVRKEHAFTNYFLPGYWPHAALYVGSPNDIEALLIRNESSVDSKWQQFLDADEARPERVLESMKDGVRIRSLSNPFRSDAMAVIRPSQPKENIAAAIARGFFHVGKPYDFDFDLSRSDRMVCTEVVYRSYEGIGDLTFELTRRAGRLTLSSEDLLQKAVNKDGFEVVGVYCPAVSASFEAGEDGSEILSRTIGRKSVS